MNNTVKLLCFVFLLVALSCSFSCGYSFVKLNENLPPDARTVYIPPFENMTTEPDLGFIIASALSREFIKSGVLLPVSKGDADLEIAGIVTSQTYKNKAYDEDDDVFLIEGSVTVGVELKNRDGSVSWSADGISDSDDFRIGGAGVVLDVGKKDAMARLCEEIARDIHDRIVFGY